jgi:alkaline phosphatase D
MKKCWLIFYCLPFLSQAQPASLIVSGPMLGQVELRTASIWLQVAPQVRTVALLYWKKGHPETAKEKNYAGPLGQEFNPLQIEIGGLDFNTAYEYRFVLDGLRSAAGGSFSTKDLWQWRRPAPDFSFLTGSCAYFNEPVYDRPGKPYGGDSSIFETMAREPAAFMLWLGDNWYTREVDVNSAWGLWYRASHDRALPVLQHFWKAMPQYAIWDDHDYGPDNSGGSYGLKDVSLDIFKKYWSNPFYGQDGQGIYTQLAYSDVDLFLTDDRYFRSADEMLDSLDGKPNPRKHFLGRKQLSWLEDALIQSSASFKIIVVGSQVLNPYSRDEGFRNYSAEFNELMRFLEVQQIQGVLFLSGDRHHSEIVRMDRPGSYPLYDITVSPFTSGVAKVQGDEINNPYRVAGSLVQEQNYGKFILTGKKNERMLTVEFHDVDGRRLSSWSISQQQLTR